jgi:hypothetical protein
MVGLTEARRGRSDPAERSWREALGIFAAADDASGIDTMLEKIRAHRDRIDPTTLVQDIRWVPPALEAATPAVAARTR